MSGEDRPGLLFTIFGGTGDLAGRKLLPALYRLSRQDLLPAPLRVLAVARSAGRDDEAYRDWAAGVLAAAGHPRAEADVWCSGYLHFQRLSEDASGYRALAGRIEELSVEAGLPPNRVFYLALPPAAFGPTVRRLGEAGLHRSDGWNRLVVEKPFGHDLPSAEALSEDIHRWFGEEQVYRIDHYLGKETVQNLLVFRFANPVFESLWNRERVESVQITTSETVGVGSRAAYYDASGALRDMVQNHLAQLLSLLAMEVPGGLAADAIRYEKVKALHAVRPILPRDVVFGRYEAGEVEGRGVPGYLEEKGVPPESTTETFVAARLWVDTWRWQGVPFYLRTGKRLARRLTQVVVNFRPPPISLFAGGEAYEHSDALVITLQPDEGFSLVFDVKAPGEPLRLVPQRLSFRYADAFEPLPEAYETLLLDVMTGDQTLFVHHNEVTTSWRLFEPLLGGEREIHGYPAGSWGPEVADRLLAGQGHAWRVG